MTESSCKPGISGPSETISLTPRKRPQTRLERLARWFQRVFSGRRTAEKKLPEILFYPVIFANGRDDDTEGVKAFYENRPYILHGDVYHPSDLPRTLSQMHLRFHCARIEFVAHGQSCASLGIAGQAVYFDVTDRPRRVITHCTVSLCLPVMA